MVLILLWNRPQLHYGVLTAFRESGGDAGPLLVNYNAYNNLPVSCGDLGWGYCDSVREQVQMLETTLGKEEETAPPNAPPVLRPAT